MKRVTQKPQRVQRVTRPGARAVGKQSVARGWRVCRAGEVQILRARLLEALPWLEHGFSTRTGGLSDLDGCGVLNLGTVDWDSPSRVAANRRAFLTALATARGSRRAAPRFEMVTLEQIHSDVIHHLDAPPRGILRGDAAVTRVPGLLLCVQTADCVPILLADARHRAVAAVHAGWRGTLARIAAKILGRMTMLYGTRPGDVRAALGPGIGRCCYEVGIEVVQQFHAQFDRAREWFDGPFDRLVQDDTPNPLQWLNRMPPGHQPPPPSAHLDLLAANRWQLLDAGVPARRIASSGLCTACRTDLLFSHRREHGRTGRMLSVIGIL